MTKAQLKELLTRYENGSCTAEEKALLETWFMRQHATSIPGPGEIEADLDEVWAKLNAGFPVARKLLWPRIAAAASVILALSFGGYYFLHREPAQQLSQWATHDIAPGRSRATLILAGGQKIILTKTLNGRIAQQGTVRISAGEALTYQGQTEELQYNTLSTARGEESPYALILADGTKVWLNAESSITYPVAFNGKERSVTLTGEAYFEVAHDEAKTFKVIANGQTIEDVGTHFNVNAYNDEPFLRATLIEGGIKVAGTVVKPGQQAIVDRGAVSLVKVNTDDVIAWKNGQTSFSDEDIQEIMRQVSRWYDVDIAYEGHLQPASFTGGISRSSSLNHVLKVLELNNIHFTVEGRKITVKP